MYAALEHALSQYQGTLDQVAQMMSSARARLLVALAAREDMDEVLAEGQRELTNEGATNV